MEIGLPGGSVWQLAMTEGQIARVDVPERGRFGFQPTFEADSEWALIVTVFAQQGQDWNRLGQVGLSLDGPAIASQTSPSFRIRVRGVSEKR